MFIYLITIPFCDNRFNDDTLEQLAEVVYDAQDENLTHLFLEKIDGDLSPCNLSWNIVAYLAQVTKKQVTLDLAEGRFNVLKVPSLLAVLDKVCFKRQEISLCTFNYINRIVLL